MRAALSRVSRSTSCSEANAMPSIGRVIAAFCRLTARLPRRWAASTYVWLRGPYVDEWARRLSGRDGHAEAERALDMCGP